MQRWTGEKVECKGAAEKKPNAKMHWRKVECNDAAEENGCEGAPSEYTSERGWAPEGLIRK
jgi:hypothetical protein